MNTNLRLIALSIALAAPLAQAGTVAGFGGATEITQLSNNVQLGMAYARQVETALNSARQYQLMIEQIRRNPAGFADRMTSADIQRHIANAEAANRMVERLDSLHQNSSLLYGKLGHARDTMVGMEARGHSITLEEYYAAVHQLAMDESSVWDDRIAEFKASSSRAEEDIESVNQIVAQADGMTTEIQGLSSVVASNAVIARQLADLNLALRQESLISYGDNRNEAKSRAMVAESLSRMARERAEIMEWASRHPEVPRDDSW